MRTDANDDELEIPIVTTTRALIHDMLRAKILSGRNIWTYYSPKHNHAQYVVVNNLTYIWAMLAEGNPEISWYRPSELVVAYVDERGRSRKTSASFSVGRSDGRSEWISMAADGDDLASSTLARQVLEDAAKRAGAEYSVFTEKSIARKDIEIENWAVLVACMNRGRRNRFMLDFETRIIADSLNDAGRVTVFDLLGTPGVDEGKMLAAIGFSIAGGSTQTNLKTQRLCLASVLKWKDKSEAIEQQEGEVNQGSFVG
ncbi:hypothetical protein B0G80_5918 [Paraburkholderia sp. BL6669N2]|uniref:hypothetical protein n=1 Tax=Paraburkholderia sp. BL6669N2 TaxID=1938807 RepID=UPI000E24813F|nr:hypothetical protein [Paraburkholderia sp. BL6669N2]REG49544.1 hypothetical protein B0G80_5918 [Paraburkholderia sp. BL6669N2]